MGNSFVLFDVSMEISRRQFHFGQIGHTQKKCFPAGKSHLPKGKMARVTAAIMFLVLYGNVLELISTKFV